MAGTCALPAMAQQVMQPCALPVALDVAKVGGWGLGPCCSVGWQAGPGRAVDGT